MKIMIGLSLFMVILVSCEMQQPSEELNSDAPMEELTEAQLRWRIDKYEGYYEKQVNKCKELEASFDTTKHPSNEFEAIIEEYEYVITLKKELDAMKKRLETME